MAKKPKIKAPSGRALKTQRKKLLIFLTFLTLAKVFWLWNQPKHIIFSADTENYFNALEGLVTDGLFSKATNLHYWPAGYPILMWPIAELSRNYFPFIIGVIQSALFSYSLFYFSTQLQKTTLNKLFWPVVLIISLNPTLALNAPAIGYEVNVATCFLIALGAFLKFSIRSEKKTQTS